MSDLSQLQVSSMRDRVSREEWQTRVDLAACYRLVARYGWDAAARAHERAYADLIAAAAAVPV